MILRKISRQTKKPHNAATHHLHSHVARTQHPTHEHSGSIKSGIPYHLLTDSSPLPGKVSLELVELASRYTEGKDSSAMQA